MNNQNHKENKFKLFLKNHKIALIVWASVITLVALISVAIGYRISSSFIADKNGDKDFSVVTITDEEIRSSGSNYDAFGATQFREGERSDVNDFLIEDVDYDKTTYKALSVSGILIANATKTDADSLTLKITSTVVSGNAEIFVFIDSELYSEVSINDTVELSLSGIAGKTVYVKAACESAEMSINVERNIYR